MMSPAVVIEQKNAMIVRELAKQLQAHFASVEIASDYAEVRHLLARHDTRLAVLDLEMTDCRQIEELAEDFPEVVLVSTHRLPDEQKWIETLRAGADEFCHPLDLHSILHCSEYAAHRHLARAA